MIRWNNDYNHGAHDAVLKKLAENNDKAFAGYGLDECCERAASLIKKHFSGIDADIHFLVGGTQTNFTFIASALKPYESVICADSGHINVHETGAVENTGHKVEALPHKDGKISASQIEEKAKLFADSNVKEHITEPKMVYISHPTEYGTLYSKKELTEIREICDKYNLILYLDGARLMYALGASGNDVSLSDIARLCDAFYIGGTKCGLLFGEALVLVNNSLKPHFRSYIKQNGAMLAKGWLLGLQFEAMFESGLYLNEGEKACAKALRIKEAFAEKGILPFVESNTNQQFMVVNEKQMNELAKNHIFEYEANLGNGNHCIRFCTSWNTSESDTDALIKDIFLL